MKSVDNIYEIWSVSGKFNIGKTLQADIWALRALRVNIDLTNEVQCDTSIFVRKYMPMLAIVQEHSFN